MEIYLDANATTPVLPQARAAALAAMAEDYGNPSSVHSAGLKARALMDQVRERARRVLGAPAGGRLFFVSGATEGIQTAVLSALQALRTRREAGESLPPLLLYGATEHKAVPEALRHWNRLLGLQLQVLAIPVGRDGRHDLAWLREHAPQAGLVCTMAANNETGCISDLDGIAAQLIGSNALWLVDGVQALGKLPLPLSPSAGERPIDYAPFSGHKLYAPKGIGLLYVREGAPFTPLLAGGGQEEAQRAGTENVSGIAALGAVLQALEEGGSFRNAATLKRYREELAEALQQAFPGLVFNAPLAHCLPTTLNFAVPGVASKLLLDLFDAGGLRVSGGSACSAGLAAPSYVLQAMGLPDWQAAAAVRLSFGPANDEAFIVEACARIRACGESLRASCLNPGVSGEHQPREGLSRHVVAGACCYVLSDATTRRSLVVDPVPELVEPLAQWLRCQGHELAAVLDTHSHGDHESAAPLLRRAMQASEEVDALGWPLGSETIALGARQLRRLAIPGHTQDSQAYLLHEADGALRLVFTGDMLMPGALGRSDFAQSAPLDYAPSLRKLAAALQPHTLLLPGHDYEDAQATTLQTERQVQPLLEQLLAGRLDAPAFAAAKAELEREIAPTAYQTMACGARVEARCEQSVDLGWEALGALRAKHPDLQLIDVREPYEQRLGQVPALGLPEQDVPLSGLLNALPDWLNARRPLLFVCRSGSRSAQAARALRRLGLEQAWSVAGGLALRPAGN